MAPLAWSAAARAAPPRPRRRDTAKASAAAVRELQSQLTTVFNAPVMAHGDLGRRTSGRSIAATSSSRYNAGKLMMPASNMKILTLAAAAERLGWDHRFTTIARNHRRRSRTACCAAI